MAWIFVSEGQRPHGNGAVWQNFSLLFNEIDAEMYLGYAICQACKICVKLVMSSKLVVSILLHLAKPVLGLFCLHLNKIA